MSLKCLIDPIYTAKPSHCSGVAIYRRFVHRMLDDLKRDDVFFYWLVPHWVSEEERAWLPQHPNIAYVELHSTKDRTQEYLSFPRELDAIMAFNGSHWDFDLYITSRVGLAPLAKLCMTSPRLKGQAWLKEVWLLEVMPLMTFKRLVMTIDEQVQDLFTLTGYLAADKTYVLSFHEKRQILQTAREFFNPSTVKRLDGKLQEALLSVTTGFSLKGPQFCFKRGARPFCMAYIGRNVPTANVEPVYEVMEKTWIMKGDAGCRLITCTTSITRKVKPPEMVDVRVLPREEFWRTVREDMDLALILWTDGGFSAGVAEPVVMGTPVIMMRADWSIGMFGPDYPFYVTTELQAYGMAKAFHDDYEGMYALFAEWHAKHLQPLFARREESWVYKLMTTELDEFESRTRARHVEKHSGKTNNSVIKAIVEAAEGRDEIVLFHLLREMGESGALKSVSDKLDPDDRETRGLVWATSWNELRVILKNHFGWEDASTEVGHLRRSRAVNCAEQTVSEDAA